MPRKPMTKEQLWERVDKLSDPQGCWLWLGPKNRGYGRTYWEGNKVYTHVLIYNLTGHTIPSGLDLTHSNLCVGKKHCCNPEHMTPKSHAENNRDQHRDNTMTQAKLTAEQVIQIRSRVNNSCMDLAREFGVSHSNISKILLNKSWKHLSPDK